MLKFVSLCLVDCKVVIFTAIRAFVFSDFDYLGGKYRVDDKEKQSLDF